MSRVWFITGTSRGFGREWTIAALERGDSVAATARNTAALEDLVAQYRDRVFPIKLNVADREGVFVAVASAAERFGRLDVVINNAGYVVYGLIEDISEAEARDLIETNVFGTMWVTQAALPYLRRQQSGHLIQVSSISGVGSFPNVGMYAASKWAVEGLSQALAGEVAGFGIKVTIIEPGAYATDANGSSAQVATPVEGYDEVRAAAQSRRDAMYADLGDPVATREAVLAIVDAEEPPLRIFLGDGPLRIVANDYENRLAKWREWEPVSIRAHGRK
jgi:NAD(P)-dependent dehydrogenase (short-subunit alcohol dehydrogenase family)